MKTESKKDNGILRGTIRGALTACAASTALIVAFAFVLQKQWLGVESIRFINPAVKVVSAAVAALTAAGKRNDKLMLRGTIAGGAYMAAAYVVFSLFSGVFTFDAALLTDLAMCMLSGAIVGAVKSIAG